MSRLKLVSDAVRPKMHGRVMISGPSGGGKTWTALRMALKLADGDPTKILGIDTERGSMLTYADVFGRFKHLPWEPPYDASELASVLDEIDGDQYPVTLIDTFSKFWQGQGGVLDVADGKFGGWKTARPIQERLVEQILATPSHMILCVRSKMSYSAETGTNGKQTVTRLGLSPIQDDNLLYEMNIAADIDMEHRVTITKSRTNAVPVGRMYPAGLEQKLAADYREWLDGGVPPASKEDVDRIVGRFAEVIDADERTRLKSEFKAEFGMPHSITALQVADAEAWLTAHLSPEVLAGSIPDNPEFDVDGDDQGASEPLEPVPATSTPPDGSGASSEPETVTMGSLAPDVDVSVARSARVTAYCMGQDLSLVEVAGEPVKVVRKVDEDEAKFRVRVATKLIAAKWDPDVADPNWNEPV